MRSKVTPIRIAAELVIWFFIMSAALFGAAGTFLWLEAWLFLVLQFSFSTYAALWLKKRNPELLKERMTFCKPTARVWDKAYIWISTGIFIFYLILPGLDAMRYGWSEAPVFAETAGFLGIVVSFAVIFVVMKENPYLSRVVEIQKERGHRVVETGPYRYVRHPMYAGAVILFLSIPLALGSYWTLVPAFSLIILLLLRTRFEDKVLHEELEGYRAYAKRTKYRILPGVW